MFCVNEIILNYVQFFIRTFESAFKNIKGQARITELNIAATLKDIRRALVDADVNYKIAKEFTDRVKEKAIGEKVINAISPGQLMVKIVKDELADLMGGEEAVFNAKGNPAVILNCRFTR